MSQSSFWKMSDGKVPEKKTSYDAGAGFALIPEGTNVLGLCDEAGWKAGFQGEPDLIQLRWTILAPAEYKGRVLFQKIKVNADDVRRLEDESNEDFAKRSAKGIKAADNAKRMLMAIDTNAGGKLSKLNEEPEDEQLMAAFLNKQMILKLSVWNMNDKQGNWVSAVAPKTAPKPAPKQEEAEPETETEAVDEVPIDEDTKPTPRRRAPAKTTEPTNLADMDDDIPF